MLFVLQVTKVGVEAWKQLEGSSNRNLTLTECCPFLSTRFAFDRVFDETSSQVDVFEHTTRHIIDGVLDGINCSVFAYGATGAGKTYTMLGNLENPGVMFLTMMELYRRINQLRDEKIFEVAVSYCEVCETCTVTFLEDISEFYV